MKDVSGKKTLCMVFAALMFSMIFISAGSATIGVEEGDWAKYGSTRIRASTTYHVYPGDSIQEAINSAQPGDTIFVHNRTYTYVFITYQHSEHEVIIISEFPTWASMVLILFAAAATL